MRILKQNKKRNNILFNKRISSRLFFFTNVKNIKKRKGDGLLNKNFVISSILFNHSYFPTYDAKEDTNVLNAKKNNFLDFFIYKHFSSLLLGKRKQLYFFIREFLNVNTLVNKDLWKDYSFQNVYPFLAGSNYLRKESLFKKELFNLITNPVLLQKEITCSYFENQENNRLNMFLIKNFFIFKNLFFSFSVNSVHFNKFLTFYLFDFFFKSSLVTKEIFNYLNLEQTVSNKYFVQNLRKLLRLKHTNSIYFNNYFVTNKLALVTKNIKENKDNLFVTLWKQGGLKKNVKSSLFSKYKNKKRDMNAHSLYLLKIIDEKIQRLKNKENSEHNLKKLENLKNFLWSLWSQGVKRSKGRTLILSKIKVLYNIRSLKWKYLFEKAFLNYINTKLLNKTLSPKDKLFYLKMYNKILNKQKTREVLNSNKKGINPFFKFSKKFSKLNQKKYWRKPLSVKAKFTEKKIVNSNKYLSLNRQKQFLSFFLGSKTMLYFVNALSLSKFSFEPGINKSTANTYLSAIEREMVNKYKYTAIYIKDLVYISYLSFFLKKASFLVKFIAFQLEKLPKNRKETKFLSFVKKVVKVFSGERKEIIGVRIKFKGRINRWRRTKIISGLRGVILDLSFDSRIDYGNAKAITRKGTFGIHLWIAYKSEFKKELYKVIWDYVNYSKVLRLKTLRKFYFNYN